MSDATKKFSLFNQKREINEQLTQARNKVMLHKEWLNEKPCTHIQWDLMTRELRNWEHKVKTLELKLQNLNNSLPALGYGHDSGAVICNNQTPTKHRN